ncbi:tachykinin-like peptides receptor 99D [Lineus longissimus]|uniref:tachykinin-like peptides receptor 99D n=1 Tax=Lineus longissimus TaxID=88925 RepID=UPI002B4EA538
MAIDAVEYKVLCDKSNSTHCAANDSNPCAFFDNSKGCGYRNDTVNVNIYLLPIGIQIAYFLFFGAMMIAALSGNIVIMWIVLAHKRMRSVTNYFLLNLAIADASITAFNTFFNLIYLMYGHWPFGRLYCKFSLFTSVATISSSVFTFMAIAIDRYTAIIHPLKPRMSGKTAIGAIALIWAISVVLAVPNLWFGELQYNPLRTICYLHWPDGAFNTWDMSYAVILLFSNYIVPLLACTIAYSWVGLELWGSRTIGENTFRQGESIRSKRKVVKMMIIVVFIFGVCWLPQHVYFIVASIDMSVAHQPYTQHVYLVIYWVAMSNSMYNAFIYCWMNSRFREGFRYAFRWLPCVNWRPSERLGLRMGGPSYRQQSVSVTETTRCERNGSLMQTMDSMDSDEGQAVCPGSQRRHPGGPRGHYLTPQYHHLDHKDMKIAENVM